MDDPQPQTPPITQQPQTSTSVQQPIVPASPNMQSILQDAGMRRVSNPPSENDLRTYYTRHAPAHDQIRQGHFDTAAAEYRRLADASTNPEEQARFRTTATQLDVTHRMQQAGVRNPSFPPTETNVQNYFQTMRGRPLGDIQNAFQDYSRAFYVHSETRGVDRGDITYDAERHTIGNERWTTRTPEDWNDINNAREMHTDGRRIMDCEGYAYLGQRALQAAGFSNGQYAAASRNDNPNTAQNEQFSNQHMMYSASRTVRDPDGTQRTEILAISNDRMFQGASAPNPSSAESETAEIRTLTQAYRQTFRHRDGSAINIPGGIMVREREAWRAQISLDQALSSRN